MRQVITENKIKVLSLFAFVMLGLAYRFMGIYSVSWDQDSLTNVLQAYKILRGLTPTFFPGQDWMGIVGNYGLAIMFALFGKSLFVGSLFAWMLSGIYLLAVVFFACYAFGINVALFTSLFLVIPTYDQMYWACHPRVDYQVCFIITPLILLLTLVIIRQFKDKSLRQSLFFVLGVLYGVGVWTNMATATAVLTSFICLSSSLRKVLFKEGFIYLFVGGFIGFFPVVYYNISEEMVLFSQTSGFSNMLYLPYTVYAFVLKSLPVFFGIYFDKMTNFWYKASGVFFIGYLITVYFIFGYHFFRRIKRHESVVEYGLIAGYLFVHCFVAFSSNFGLKLVDGNILYLSMLYGITLIIPAIVISKWIGKRWRILFCIPIVLFLLNNLNTTYFVVDKFMSVMTKMSTFDHHPFPQENLFSDFCKKNKVFSGYYKNFADGLILDCVESVRFSQFYQEDYLEDALIVDSSKDIFWVDPPLSASLAMIGCEYKMDYILSRQVFKQFRKQKYEERVVTDYAINTECRLGEEHFLNDANSSTFWSMGKHNKGQIRIFFNRPRKLSRISMTTLSYVEFPKNFSIKVSQDGNTWKEIFQIKETLPTFWSVFHPFLKVVKPRLEIDLSGDDFVQYCRIDIKATDKYPVKISELYVYERIGKHVTERELECDVDSLIHYIETLGKQWVIVADHWFVNYFKLQDYNVDFISNKFVNDSGKINPCFSVPNILDFQKKHLFILEKAQSSLFQKNMSRLKIPYTMKNFDFYTLFFVDKNTMTNDFYWDGLNIKRVFDPKKQRYKLCSPSLVDCFKNTAGKNEQEIIIANYVFEDCFSLSAYFLEYKQRKQKIMMAFEVNMLKNVQYGSYLFVHFCDQQGKILFQGDIKMQNFIGTTDKWMPGTRAVLDGEVNVPEGIKGEVTVKVGIWHPETGKKYKDISTGNSFVVLKKVSL